MLATGSQARKSRLVGSVVGASAAPSPQWSVGEIDPGRGVIAGLLPTAHGAIDAGRGEPPGERWAQQ